MGARRAEHHQGSDPRRGEARVARLEHRDAVGTATRLCEIYAQIERLAPAVNRWLCISPDTRGPIPDTRGAVRDRVHALLEEMADLVADD